MSEPASISTGIASRYATAIFELALETKSLDTLEADVEALGAALDDSDDFRTLIHSPIYSRGEQERAVVAIAEKAGMSGTMRNTLGLMASKRRLFVLPHLVAGLAALIARHKGVVEAEVTSAQPLTDAQRDRLAETIKARVGQDIKLNTAVDEGLIGGLVVKVGSRMIDTSIRSKLAQLQNSMKEVG